MREKYKKQNKYRESVSITPEMAKAWIEALKIQGIEYYVAPYEADAQLAYLFHKGKIDFVITKDSDLLCFGVKKVFYNMEDPDKSYEINLDQLNSTKAFEGFTFDMFLTAWILSGCDYLFSIPKIGLVNAQKLVKAHKTFEEVFKNLVELKKYEIPKNYEKDFYKALLTFNFQVVYWPEREKFVYLNEIEGHELQHKFTELEDSKFLGELKTPEHAQALSRGDINPFNFKGFDQNEFQITVKTKTGKKKKANKKLKDKKAKPEPQKLMNKRAKKSKAKSQEQAKWLKDTLMTSYLPIPGTKTSDDEKETTISLEKHSETKG